LGKANIELKRIQKGVNTLLKEIEDLKEKKNKIQNIQVVQQPTSSLYPINPGVKRNVISAAAASFLLVLFLAFFLEYLLKFRK
jgi:uncharacterized protein involved in exopolysaccharide biosynthesis